ncbi:beta-ketoacyl-ACP synthase [Piscinibacter sp.]|uniref:beta-ketoacyl-ACP synthase n=1 Tax=Piscinibacter sp. TaxID=1903157 RepID=UPI00338DA319
MTAWTLLGAAGAGQAALRDAVAAQASGLRPHRDAALPLECWTGRLDTLDDAALPAALAEWDCRATRLAWQALQLDGFIGAVQAAVARHGAARVGLVLGSAASTIGASEQAYRTLAPDGGFPAPLRSPRLNTPHALALFVQAQLGLEGPCLTVSTACSSSAKAFACAERWLRLELADAVVVAGVDALCGSLLYGFRALGLVASEPCRPFDAQRRGISLGEAAGFALLARGPGAMQLLGYGESNDAHHMSGPHPQGLGAEAALDDALARAALAPDDIDYLNLHGTATPQNDEVEAALVARRYPATVHASATKGLTGHTMGAAGLVEAALCWTALAHGLRSGSAFTAAPDPALGERFAAQLRLAPAEAPTQVAASHSFGFGGSNAVLLFGRGEAA